MNYLSRWDWSTTRPDRIGGEFQERGTATDRRLAPQRGSARPDSGGNIRIFSLVPHVRIEVVSARRQPVSHFASGCRSLQDSGPIHGAVDAIEWPDRALVDPDQPIHPPFSVHRARPVLPQAEVDREQPPRQREFEAVPVCASIGEHNCQGILYVCPRKGCLSQLPAAVRVVIGGSGAPGSPRRGCSRWSKACP